MTYHYDAIVIGGGHNGLVCANYLQKSGFNTLLCERRHIIGGAVCTEEIYDGYKYDIGSSVHIMIHQTPIVHDLELHRFGLEYCPMDPWATYPLPDGSGRAICFHRSLDETCDSIAKISPKDGVNYRRFIGEWESVAKGTMRAFMEPPTLMSVGRHLVLAQGPAKSSTEESLRRIFTSYGRLIRETFVSPEVRAALSWLAAQSGPPPSETASAPFAGWHAIVHETGAAHPKGGSGMLTQALANAFQANGGAVRLNAPVKLILMEGDKACGVVLENGDIIRTRAVIAACHVLTTFTKLLAPNDVPSTLLSRIRHIHVGNGFGATLRCASSEMPDYGDGLSSKTHIGMQLLCPSEAFLQDSYADYVSGMPSRKPPVLAMTFSPIDDTLAPKGMHTLSLWSQYYPYARRDGKNWDDYKTELADGILSTLYEYAPNLRGKIVNPFPQTPLDLERTFGLINGNVMHVEMNFDQMFFFRPLPELAQYQTPIDGLFLCGASTHPGGGVFGASGRSAAAVVASKLKRKWWQGR